MGIIKRYKGQAKGTVTPEGIVHGRTPMAFLRLDLLLELVDILDGYMHAHENST